MSRAFMPWYVGDYLRDTGHLTTEQHGAYMLLLGHCWQHGAIPLDDKERAAIAKLSIKRWRAIKAPIERFFNDDGTQKRVSRELAKADVVSMKRKLAGAKGGFHSSVAKVKQTPKQKPSKPPSKSQANAQQTTQQNSSNRSDSHNHNSFLTKTLESVTARASPAEALENQDNSAGSLATARYGGALARPPGAENVAKKPPHEVTRAELDAIYAARRGGGEKPP